MLRESFKIDQDANQALLLRIVVKIDFADEVLWAKSFAPGQADALGQIQKKVEDFLREGSQATELWESTEEFWHLCAPQHYGFKTVCALPQLCSLLISGGKSHRIVQALVAGIKQMPDFADLLLPSFAGSVAQALIAKRIRCPQPAEAAAIVKVPAKYIAQGNFEAIAELLAPFSR